MDSFVFSDVLNVPHASYLIRTLNNDSKQQIMSSVFCEGSLIKFRQDTYNGNVSEDELITRIKRFHKETKQGLATLFELSEKFAASRQLGKRILLGRAFIKNKMFKEAIGEFERILQAGAGHSIIHYYLGQIHLQLEEYPKAVQYLKQAIRLNQTYADYHFCSGKALLAMQKCKNAIEEFNQAVELNPYYGRAYYYLGLAYLCNAIRKEDYSLAKEVSQKATQYFKKAAQIDLNYSSDDFSQGFEHLKEGRLTQSYTCFLKALEEENKSIQQDFIIDFYVKYLNDEQHLPIDEIQKYIRQLQNAIRKCPQYADLHYELGIAYVIMSKFLNRRAIRNFERALSINSEFSKAEKKFKLLKNEQRGIETLLKALLEP